MASLYTWSSQELMTIRTLPGLPFLAMSKDKTLFPKWASVFFGWTDQIANFTITSWGTSMGGSEGGKTYWCCRMITGRKKKWLLNYTFFPDKWWYFQSHTSLKHLPNSCFSSVPTSATTTNFQFYLYFLEAWHHLQIFFLISYISHTHIWWL